MAVKTNENVLSPISLPKAGESPWRSAWTKATFLLLCWISYGIALLIGAGIIFLIQPRLLSMNEWLNIRLDFLIFGVFILFYLILGSGLFLLTATSLTGIDLLYPHNRKSVTVTLLFPIAITLSQIFGINRNKLRTSYIKVNNALTKAQRKRINGGRILILLPHCLQIDVCNRKITTNIHTCKQCGNCPVGSLLELEKKYNLTFEVVNGGTLARRKVKSFRPTGIVAVACERDLTFGIQEVYPIPVYGVINDRPNGPCFNTCVDMGIVEEAIQFFKDNQRVTKHN